MKFHVLASFLFSNHQHRNLQHETTNVNLGVILALIMKCTGLYDKCSEVTLLRLRSYQPFIHWLL